MVLTKGTGIDEYMHALEVPPALQSMLFKPYLACEGPHPSRRVRSWDTLLGYVAGRGRSSEGLTAQREGSFGHFPLDEADLGYTPPGETQNSFYMLPTIIKPRLITVFVTRLIARLIATMTRL